MASQLTLSRVSLSQEVHFEQVKSTFFTLLWGTFPLVEKR